MPEHHTQILTRRNIALGCGLLAIVAVVSLILLSNDSGATANASAPPPPSYAAYPALNSTEPTGLPLVTHSGNGPAAPSAGPTFPATPPASATEEWPEAQSIRKVSVKLPTISAWISKGISGGLCVLSSSHAPVRPGVYGVAFSCAPADRASSGATVESETAGSNRITIAGVVPIGVSAVQVGLADGNTKIAVVSGGAWALETEASIQSVHDVVGG
jgi:hypothetical protein